MSTITIEVPEALSEQLALLRDRLPELLALSLQQPALPAQTYRFIVDFLASQPSPDEVVAFGPTPEMTARLRILVGREVAGELTPLEQTELDEYELIEHLMVMIKTGCLPFAVTGA